MRAPQPGTPQQQAYTDRPARPGAGAELSVLTSREMQVLRLVATRAPNEDIARSLFIGEATVKARVNRLMAKSGVVSRAQAVVVAYESGLVVAASAPAARHDVPVGETFTFPVDFRRLPGVS